MALRMWMAAIAAGACAFGANAAQATWKKAESANFIVFSEAGDDNIREQVALLEDYHGFLRLLTNVADPPAPARLHVYMVKNRARLRDVRTLPKEVAGFYTATGSGIAAFVADEEGGLGEELLFHEIAHHFMMQYRPMAYPAWFVEGFAEYVATARFKPKQIEFGGISPIRASWLANRQWLPLEKVLFEPVPQQREARALFYAQSWLLAHYLMRDEERKGKFKAYVAASTTGTPARKAFTDQFGADLKAFEKALRSYATGQMTYSRLTRASAAVQPEVRLERLPASADDLLLLEATMHIGVGDSYSAGHLAKVRAAAARHPADAYAKRVLAEAEVLLGDGGKGEALLDQLLLAAPQDPELLYLKGMRHLRAARSNDEKRAEHSKAAKNWFARSYKADGQRFQTLIRYAESLSATERFTSENTLNIMLLANQLAPQVSEVRINTAGILLAQKKFEEAEAMVMPLASDPHNPGLAAAAQVMLALARAKGEAPAKAPIQSSAETAGE
jgi:Flp pilus assembly protein TadD